MSAALFAPFSTNAVRVTLPYVPPNFEDLRRGVWIEEPQPALQAYMTEFEGSYPRAADGKAEALHAYAYTTNRQRLLQWLGLPETDYYGNDLRKYPQSRTAHLPRSVPVPLYSIRGGWGNFSFETLNSWDLPPNTVLLGYQVGGWQNASSRLVTLVNDTDRTQSE